MAAGSRSGWAKMARCGAETRRHERRLPASRETRSCVEVSARVACWRPQARWHGAAFPSSDVGRPGDAVRPGDAGVRTARGAGPRPLRRIAPRLAALADGTRGTGLAGSRPSDAAHPPLQRTVLLRSPPRSLGPGGRLPGQPHQVSFAAGRDSPGAGWNDAGRGRVAPGSEPSLLGRNLPSSPFRAILRLVSACAAASI